MIVFVRHGETGWNREGRVQGTIDVPLSDAGKSAAWTFAKRLAPHRPQVIWTSPLRRAVETADIMCATAPRARRPEVRSLDALIEREYGVYQGRWLRELSDGLHLQAAEHTIAGRGVEEWKQVEKRVREALLTILREPAASVVIVHGGWFKAFHAVLGTGMQRRNASNLESYPINGEALTALLEGTGGHGL